MQTRAKFLLMAAALAALQGCGDDTESLPPGSINVSWLVGTSGCGPLGVDTVAVFVEGGTSRGTNVRTFPCAAGGATITGISPGFYDLTLRGRDPQGTDRFSGTVRNVEVRSSGTTPVPTVRLSALPARLGVTWYFDNGRMCIHNGVDAVVITLFEDQYEIVTRSEECSVGFADLVDIPANDYVVDVVGVDDNGVVLFNGQESIVVNRGDSADLEVRLMPVTSTQRPAPVD